MCGGAALGAEGHLGPTGARGQREAPCLPAALPAAPSPFQPVPETLESPGPPPSLAHTPNRQGRRLFSPSTSGSHPLSHEVSHLRALGSLSSLGVQAGPDGLLGLLVMR